MQKDGLSIVGITDVINSTYIFSLFDMSSKYVRREYSLLLVWPLNTQIKCIDCEKLCTASVTRGHQNHTREKLPVSNAMVYFTRVSSSARRRTSLEGERSVAPVALTKRLKPRVS